MCGLLRLWSCQWNFLSKTMDGMTLTYMGFFFVILVCFIFFRLGLFYCGEFESLCTREVSRDSRATVSMKHFRTTSVDYSDSSKSK